MTTILRPLSTSELLDRTFHLYRNHFGLFVGIAAIPQIAVLALQLAYVEHIIRMPQLGRWGPPLVILAVNFIAIEIAHAAITIAVSKLNTDRPAEILSSYAEVKTSLPRVVWIAFVAFVLPLIISIPIALTGIGLMSVLIIGIGETNPTAAVIVAIAFFIAIFSLPLRWWLRWALVVPVTVLEGGGLRASMRRSKSLTHDRRGRIFVIYLLIVILSWVVKAVCQSPFYIIIGMRAFSHPWLVTQTARLIQVTGTFVSASLVGALLTIAITLIYYDERVRREGLDLQLMVSAAESAQQDPLPFIA
jgi:hypothetical protein